MIEMMDSVELTTRHAQMLSRYDMSVNTQHDFPTLSRIRQSVNLNQQLPVKRADGMGN